MPTLVASLREELASLEEEVRADPRLLKIERIKSLLELYGGVNHKQMRLPDPAPTEEPTISAVLDDVETESVSRNEKSKAFQVREKVRKLLEEDGPTHRTNILQRLVADGLMGKEKNPIASLAAYLSEWREEFGSDGKGVFHLRRGGSASNGNGPAAYASGPSMSLPLEEEVQEGR